MVATRLVCPAILLGLFMSFVAESALAEEDGDARPAEPAHYGGQRSFGFGPTLGFYSGLGALVAYEARPLGFVVSGGYVPLLIASRSAYDANDDPRYDFISSGGLSADLIAGPILDKEHASLSLLAGYRFNTAIGHGVGAGVRITVDLNRSMRAEFYVAPSFYFDARERIMERHDMSGRDPVVPWLQGGAFAALVFYP